MINTPFGKATLLTDWVLAQGGYITNKHNGLIWSAKK